MIKDFIRPIEAHETKHSLWKCNCGYEYKEQTFRATRMRCNCGRWMQWSPIPEKTGQ